MRHVILPQALRMAIAPTVGFLVQVVKGTSVASIIGFVELTKTGGMLANATFEPFLIYGLVAAGYFLLCYPLSLYSRHRKGHSMSLVNITGLHKHYGSNHVLKGVDLTVRQGDVVTLIGRSGSGKSTLLRTINGLESFDQGSITLAGQTIGSRMPRPCSNCACKWAWCSSSSICFRTSPWAKTS
jgi:ABC-type glutathione transport system ATPase component